MKKIESIIDPFQLNDLIGELSDIGVEEIVTTEVIGQDSQKSQKTVYRQTESFTMAVPKLKLEFFVADEFEKRADQIISKIHEDTPNRVYISSQGAYYTVDEPEPEIEPETKKAKPVTSRIDWKVTRSTEPMVRTISISTVYRADLFSTLAGVLTLNEFDISTAKIFRQGNTALGIFKINPPSDNEFDENGIKKGLAMAKTDFAEALNDKKNMSEKVGEKIKMYRSSKSRKPSEGGYRILVDNKSSDRSSLIKVYGPDFPGLLYCVTEAIFRVELDIFIAKISTAKGNVEDIFHVKDFNGQKVDSPSQVLTIKSTIEQALTGQI